jgi:uncharacterized protein (UPF0276 family)
MTGTVTPPGAQSGAPIPAAAGIGLRFQHHRPVLEQRPRVAWMEVHPENYMDGGPALAHLHRVRREYPLSLHGVGLSLGSAEGLDARHLDRLAALVEQLEPGLVSEHVAWSISDGSYLADLLPLPMTDEALDVVCRNVDAMQSRLRRRVLVENPSSYITFKHSTIPEWEFMAAVAARTDCGLLCDVNNIFVSSRNHGFDAEHYLRALPADRVGELHIAGHSLRTLEDGRSIRIDDHSRQVDDAVWALLDLALKRFGPVPTLVEWDTDIPPLGVLLGEATRAQARLDEWRPADARAA